MPRAHSLEVSRSLPAALQVMASRILRSACQIAAVLLAALFASSASAQTTEATAATIEGLDQAMGLMGSAAAFFRTHPRVPWPGESFPQGYRPPTKQELADSYTKMRERVALYLRFAQEPAVSQTLKNLA